MAPPQKAKVNYREFLTEINDSISREYDGELSNVLSEPKYTTFESVNAWLKIKEHSRVIDMRQDWSDLFKKIVLGILLFEIALTVCVGFGWMKFNDEWFLRIIISGGFLQLLSMPYTITKFLFSPNSFKNKE